MPSDFAELIDLLAANDIRFIVADGVACALNGYIRATEDVDIIVDDTPDNVNALLRVLVDWGEGHARELQPADFTREPGAIRLNEDFPLDMFTVLADKTYHDYLAGAGVTDKGIHYLCPADLIATKASSLREKDQLDIMAMQRIMREGK